jgi:hypothetical protein
VRERVCVCVRERKGGSERERASVALPSWHLRARERVCACVCVRESECVCEREWAREREGESGRMSESRRCLSTQGRALLGPPGTYEREMVIVLPAATTAKPCPTLILRLFWI